MQINKLALYKVLLLVFIILSSISFFSISDVPALELNADNELFYQDNSCKYSLFEILNKDTNQIKLEIVNNPSGPTECYGKNFWYDYQPAKNIEDGWDNFEEAKIRILMNTNISIDLIIQSIIWLLLMSFIPKSQKSIKINRKIILPIITLLSYVHLLGEKEFYSSISREFSLYIFIREYDGSINFDNYFIYIYLLTIVLISSIFIKLIEERFYNLINYLPYIFLIYGTYASLNLNFYLIIFSILGLHTVLNFQISKKLSTAYFLFSFVWIYNSSRLDIIFDVDKLRGFASTSDSMISSIFWILIIYLVICGISELTIKSKDSFDFYIFTNSLLKTSSFIFILGNLSAINKVVNYLTFYVLGLNKFGMRTLNSVDGNTWRGLAPSAEGMGEFFGFVLLFSFIMKFEKKIKLKFFDYFNLIICLAGLLKTNNAAATILLFSFSFLYFLIKKYDFGIRQLTIVFLIFITGVIIYFQSNNDHSYQYMSNATLFEGVNASIISENIDKNQYGQSQSEQANYGYILGLSEKDAQLSSSLRFLLNSYNSENNIKNIPSVISTVNVVSFFINRSEKWGIFIAKYNPDLLEFLFGYGPQQLTNFYHEHPTNFNYGLFLPHSSAFSMLIFNGLIGVLLISLLLINKIRQNSYFYINNIFLVFFLINFMKSDSILYIANFVLFIFIYNFYTYDNSEKLVDK